jgi:hypothetical protein
MPALGLDSARPEDWAFPAGGPLRGHPHGFYCAEARRPERSLSFVA